MSIASSLPEPARVRLSATLTGYIARQFSYRLAAFLAALVGVVLLVTFVDLLDRVAAKENVTMGLVLKMALLKLPYLSQEIMPFTVLFAGLAIFWRLTRNNELVVTRAAGVSVWQFLLPVVGVSVVLGALTVGALNPLSSALLGKYEQLEAEFIKNRSSLLAVSNTGLWLRQAGPDGQSVIHAERVTEQAMTLHQVIVFRYADEDRFVGRIDAPRAELRDGFWRLYDAWIAAPGKVAERVEEIDFPTDLTVDKIQESFAPPETISFWSLPSFIAVLERAGFSSQRHRLQFHKLLATPILFAAMILVAATFSLRPHRRGQVVLIILCGGLAGFLLYFLSSFVFALGLSAKIPVIMAGWTPAGVSLMLGIAMLMHLEDG